ncbi:MAG: hypothetical protein ITG02_15345, partial [Patulibacter sp.]|nr:hypothetical protein [Patulibacter sp.]
MMIGPEQGKKPAKSGKKKDKAKKAKRQAVEADPGRPSTAAATEPVARDRGDGADESPASAVPPAFGPPLLAWIDRVQERIDHLLTLTDLSAPTASEGSELDLPPATESAPAAAGVATPPVTEPAPGPPADPPPAEPTPAPAGDGLATPSVPRTTEDEAHRLSLAEAWARRLEAEGEEAAGADDERDASVAASNDGSAADPEEPTVEEA